MDAKDPQGSKAAPSAGRQRARRTRADEGPDAVRCLLCKRRFGAVTATHLWASHGFEGNHPVRDYKARFGLRVATCQTVCTTHRRTIISTHRRGGHFWPRERVLRALRERARKGLPLAHSRLPSALVQSVRRRFGSWAKGMIRAGLDPEAHRLHRSWDERSLVAGVRALRTAGTRVSGKRALELEPSLYRAAIRLVGSWRAALRLAGFDPAEHREPRVWTKERASAWVRRTHRAGGSVRATDTPGGLLCHVRAKLGMRWPSFVESVGVRYPDPLKRLDWTDEAVLESIRERHRRGQPITLGAVQEDGQAVTQQARIRFGSWDAAVRAAGLEPQRLAQSRPRESILRGIRSRKRAGGSLRRAHALAEDRRFVRAAEKMFGSWGAALEAAGLPRRAARGS